MRFFLTTALFIGYLLPLALAGRTVAAPLSRADSLRQRLTTPGVPDTARVTVYLRLSRLLLSQDLPAARRYAREGQVLAQRLGDDKRALELLNNRAAGAYYADDLLEAQRLFEELAHAARRTDHCKLLGHAYLGLGNVMGALDAEARAREYYAQARTIYASCNPPEIQGQALILLNIGLNYLNVGKFAEAAPYVRQGVGLVGQFENERINLSLLVNLSTLQRAEHHPDSAEATLTRALTLARARENERFQGLALLGLAELRMARDPAGARPLVEEGLTRARAMADPSLIADGLRIRAELLRRLGQGTAAFDTLQRYLTLHDTLSRQDLHDAIAQQQVRFDVAQQKARITELSQQRNAAERQRRAYGVAALSLLLLVVAGSVLIVLLTRSRRRLQASEGALRQANDTKEQLMRIIGHDLRAPVASFQQLTPLLHDVVGQADPADAHELIRLLDAGSQQLGALVDNLLHWTRVRSGLVASQPAALQLAPVVAGIVSLYAPVAQLKGVRLSHDVPPSLPAWADQDLLAAVLRNLLSNAIKFTPAGGTVWLRATATPDGAEVEVRDSGVGIPAERLATLFADERAASTPGTNGEPGTGLGLPLCARFVRLLGGELRVEANPGAGTRFWFRLPAVPVTAAAPAREVSQLA